MKCFQGTFRVIKRQDLMRLPVGLASTAVILITLLLAGCVVDVRISDTPSASPAPSPTASPADWSASLDSAMRFHIAGRFGLAVDAYDMALDDMPANEALIAVRAGANIKKGQALLLMGSGLAAIEAGIQANESLDRATDQEKAGTAWNFMMTQAMTVASSGLLFVSIDSGEELTMAMEGLLVALQVADFPEIHFFLGIGYVELGRPNDAKFEFQAFLNSRDELLTFLGKETMRELAEVWIANLE